MFSTEMLAASTSQLQDQLSVRVWDSTDPWFKATQKLTRQSVRFSRANGCAISATASEPMSGCLQTDVKNECEGLADWAVDRCHGSSNCPAVQRPVTSVSKSSKKSTSRAGCVLRMSTPGAAMSTDTSP